MTGFVFVQRTNRMPKDIHVEPEKFAAELISRLEAVLREREAQEKLEERLKRVRQVRKIPKMPKFIAVFLFTTIVDSTEKPKCLVSKHVFCDC